MDNHEGRGGTMSTWYGVVDKNTLKASKEDSMNGIIDFSSSSKINIISQVVMQEGETRFEILIENPIILEKDKETELKPYKPYEVKKGSGNDLVLELDTGEIDIKEYSFCNDVVDARYSKVHPGWKKSYVFPISYDSTTNKALLYLGDSDEDYFFYLQMTDKDEYKSIGKGKIREITSDEKDLINFVNVTDGGEQRLGPSNKYFIPIIFKGAEKLNSLSVRAFISESSYSVSLRSAPYGGGRGYAGTPVRNNEVITLSERRVLEHAVLMNDKGIETEFILQFSKEEPFLSPPSPKKTPIDFSSLEDNTTTETYKNLTDWDNFALSGFSEGYLYGFYVNNERSTGSNTKEIYHLIDNIYILTPTSFDSTIEFSPTSYANDINSEIVFFKYKAGETNFITTDKTPLLSRTVGEKTYDYYIHYAKIDTSKLNGSEVYVLFDTIGSYDDYERRTLLSNNGITIGIETEPHSLISGDSLYALMLFSKEKTDESATSNTFYACNPTIIGNETLISSFPAVLRIEPNATNELALDLDLSNDTNSSHLADFVSAIQFIYDNNGEEKVYAFPLSYDDASKVLTLYLGKVEKGASIAILGNWEIKATVRDATEDEKNSITYEDLQSGEFELKASSPLLSIVFNRDESIVGKKLKLTFDNSATFYYWYNSKNRDSKGDGSREWSISKNTIPEFISVWADGLKENTKFTITIE